MTFWKLAGAAALGLAVAACSGGGDRARPAPVAQAPVSAAEIDAIAAQLLAGDVDAARRSLKAVLKREPNNASAQLLSTSIERDAKEMLGPRSYAYTVRAGDTIAGVAQKALGNRLKAYQLARYNDLTPPFALAPGQSLRIPGTPPRVDPPVRRPEPAPTRPAPSATPAPAPKPLPQKPAAPVAPAANPGAARQYRTAGLAALNQGKVAQAVSLLRRAAAADPGNPLIARDLARAERIAATVRARR